MEFLIFVIILLFLFLKLKKKQNKFKLNKPIKYIKKNNNQIVERFNSNYYKNPVNYNNKTLDDQYYIESKMTAEEFFNSKFKI